MSSAVESTQTPYESERAMTEPLIAAAEEIAISSGEIWLVLQQHQVHSRIADVVLARVDRAALEERLAGGWLRPLNESELRVLRNLRPDRGTRLATLAAKMRWSPERARRVAGALVSDHYAEKSARGSYARVAPIAPIVDRAISFEAKRSDPLAALLQARAHGLFADRRFVGFDAAYLRRFEAMRAAYRAEGIGLIALSADDDSYRLLLRAGPSPLRHVLGLALGAERSLGRLLGRQLRRLPESNLPNASASSVGQAEPRLVGPRPRSLMRRLAANAPAALG